MGARLFNEQKYEEACGIFQELADYNATNYKVYETLALIYLKLENVTAAEEAYKKAVELYSKESRAPLKLQSFEEAVSQLESIEKLQELYESATENAPTAGDDVESDEAIHRLPVMMGMKYMAAGEFKKAEELLVKHRDAYFQKA